MSAYIKETGDQKHIESADGGSQDLKIHHGDKALAVSEQRVHLTEEDSRRICRKTDIYVLTLLSWVYFLQILDKTVIGYAAVFDLITGAKLHGTQYSTIGSIGYYAQLAAQPLATFLLVKYRPKYTLSIVVFLWGCSQLGLCGSTNFTGLAASRFFLGWFEAACLPIFTLLTAAWYRRSEQPMRVALWYGTNGLANVLGAPLCYGIGHIHAKHLFSYQIIFLLTGLVTVITAVVVFLFLQDSPLTAKFLSPEDRAKAVERLRANNTGISSDEFKWRQVVELFTEPKMYLFVGITICLNLGASISSTFGPLLLKGLVGFDKYTAILLNIPYGALQTSLILGASYIAYRYKNKSKLLFLILLPVIMGTAILYKVPRVKSNQGPLLFGYYCLSFLFAGNPLILSWILANTAGQSKRTAMVCIYNASSAAGNIIGPYLFKAKDAPDYIPGIKAVMAVFCICAGLVVLQVINFTILNKRKEAARAKAGKVISHDTSMNHKYTAMDEGTGDSAFLDLTDRENIEFVYVL